MLSPQPSLLSLLLERQRLVGMQSAADYPTVMSFTSKQKQNLDNSVRNSTVGLLGLWEARRFVSTRWIRRWSSCRILTVALSFKQVGVQLHTSADNMTLLCSRLLLNAVLVHTAAVDRYRLPAGSAAVTRRTLMKRSIDRTDRRTDTVSLHRSCCIGLLCEQCRQNGGAAMDDTILASYIA